MPTLRPDKGGRWLARVVLDGRQIACKMFPPGKKFGPQWRAAKKWEEEQLAKGDSGTGDPHGLGTAYGLGE